MNYNKLNREQILGLYIQARESLKALAALYEPDFKEPSTQTIFNGNPSEMYEAGILAGLNDAGDEALEWLEALEQSEKELNG